MEDEIDYREHMGWAGMHLELPEYVKNEEHWKEGVHYDRADKMYLLTEMTDDHLLAAIRYFKHEDTTPLKREARRRHLELGDINK